MNKYFIVSLQNISGVLRGGIISMEEIKNYIFAGETPTLYFSEDFAWIYNIDDFSKSDWKRAYYNDSDVFDNLSNAEKFLIKKIFAYN